MMYIIFYLCIFFVYCFVDYSFFFFFFFFSSRRRHTRCLSEWSSDVCSSDLGQRRGDALLAEREEQEHGREHRRDQNAAGETLHDTADDQRGEAVARGAGRRRRGEQDEEIGRASCRERV